MVQTRYPYLVSAVTRVLWRIGRFIAMLVHYFVRDDGLQNAAALTFTTLLSLVPLMAVSIALFSAFPVYDKVGEEVQDLIFKNLVPASGEVIQDYMQEFSRKASRMTGAGTVFLVVVALMMMGNIDRAINTIWRVQRPRRWINLFVVYWSILSLGPVLIGISVAITSYVVSLPLFTEAAETVGLGVNRLLALLPIPVSALAFTLLYLVVPNRRVPFAHAVLGGVLAATLFELAKRGFAFYFTQFPTYEVIYGALASVPIFLIWIYLSWLVTLLGAEFTYCLGVYRDDWDRAGEHCGQSLFLAFRVLQHLWRARPEGAGISLRQLLRLEPSVSEETLEHLLHRLSGARLLLVTDNHQWALAQDLSEVTLLDLYQAAPFTLPREQDLKVDRVGADAPLVVILQQVQDDLNRAMDCSLAEIFRQQQSPGGTAP